MRDFHHGLIRRYVGAGANQPVTVSGGKATLEIASVLDHELIVLE